MRQYGGYKMEVNLYKTKGCDVYLVKHLGGKFYLWSVDIEKLETVFTLMPLTEKGFKALVRAKNLVKFAPCEFISKNRVRILVDIRIVDVLGPHEKNLFHHAARSTKLKLRLDKVENRKYAKLNFEELKYIEDVRAASKKRTQLQPNSMTARVLRKLYKIFKENEAIITVKEL